MPTIGTVGVATPACGHSEFAASMIVTVPFISSELETREKQL